MPLRYQRHESTEYHGVYCWGDGFDTWREAVAAARRIGDRRLAIFKPRVWKNGELWETSYLGRLPVGRG